MFCLLFFFFFFFSSRRRHTRSLCDWSSDVCSSDLPSAIPIESVHGQKEDPGRTLRLTVRAVLGPRQMGDFSIRPQQGAVRAVFVPLARLQEDLEQRQLVNAMLLADRGEPHGDRLPALL